MTDMCTKFGVEVSVRALENNPEQIKHTHTLLSPFNLRLDSNRKPCEKICNRSGGGVIAVLELASQR